VVVSDKLEAHLLLSALKDLAAELGRRPTQLEFERQCYSNRQIRKYFGTWGKLLEQCGFDTYHTPKLKSKSERANIFAVSIEKHLEDYVPREIPEPLPLSPNITIASISDIHWPFENKKVVKRFIEYCGDEKPDKVIINGDAADQYSHAKFPRSHNVFTPEEEENLWRERNTQFWIDVKKVHPNAECYQLLGNHDVRVFKRTMEVQPQIEHWVKKYMAELFKFDGVTTIMDPREELIFGNIAIFHGYRSKLGDHRDYTLMNCINGHTHMGGVVFRKIRGGVLWELNSGLAGDPEARGLTYTGQKIGTWTPGFGALNRYGPQFVAVP
jgi:predicted phosphodiesterase